MLLVLNMPRFYTFPKIQEKRFFKKIPIRKFRFLKYKNVPLPEI